MKYTSIDAINIRTHILFSKSNDKFNFGAAALQRVHGFQLGDSTNEWKKKKWDDFQEKLSKVVVSFLLECSICSSRVLLTSSLQKIIAVPSLPYHFSSLAKHTS